VAALTGNCCKASKNPVTKASFRAGGRPYVLARSVLFSCRLLRAHCSLAAPSNYGPESRHLVCSDLPGGGILNQCHELLCLPASVTDARSTRPCRAHPARRSADFPSGLFLPTRLARFSSARKIAVLLSQQLLQGGVGFRSELGCLGVMSLRQLSRWRRSGSVNDS